MVLGVGSATRLLPFDWLEAFGFISGAWGVWLQVRENVWNWPIQLISSAFYVVVFLNVRLFSDAWLNVLYVVLTCSAGTGGCVEARTTASSISLARPLASPCSWPA